jgi:hypothetical protein
LTPFCVDCDHPPQTKRKACGKLDASLHWLFMLAVSLPVKFHTEFFNLRTKLTRTIFVTLACASFFENLDLENSVIKAVWEIKSSENFLSTKTLKCL